MDVPRAQQEQRTATDVLIPAVYRHIQLALYHQRQLIKIMHLRVTGHVYRLMELVFHFTARINPVLGVHDMQHECSPP